MAVTATAMATTTVLLLAMLWASQAGFLSKTSTTIPLSSSRKLLEPSNKWLSTIDFTCNVPRIRQNDDGVRNRPYSGAILECGKTRRLHDEPMKRNVGQQEITKKIILFRTMTTESEVNDGLSKTWIFSSRNHAWRSVESKAHPRCGEVYFTATLCDCQVVVIGGLRNDSANRMLFYDRISIFDGDEDIWLEPHIVNSELFRKFKWDMQNAAVAIVDSVSHDVSDRCRCRESVLLFSATRSWTSVLKLKCVKDRQEYEWEEIASSPSPLPQMPMTNTVASVKERFLVYILAKNGLWQFNAEESNWNSVSASRTSSDLKSIPPSISRYKRRIFKAYATEDSYILYDCSMRDYVLLYDFVQNLWTSFDSQRVVFPVDTWWTTDLQVDGRVILLSSKKCRSEVWQITRQSENLWVWDMIETASVWPHRDDGLFASVLHEEYLYLCSSSKNGYFSKYKKVAITPLLTESTEEVDGAKIAGVHVVKLRKRMKRSLDTPTHWVNIEMSNYLDFSFWRLSLRTLTWEKVWQRPTPGVRQNNFLHTAVVDTATYLSPSLITMTGMKRTTLQSKSFLPQLHVWAYNTDDGSIVYCKTAQDQYKSAPTTRYLYAVAALNSSAILLFGGTLSTLNKNTRSPSYWNGTLHHSLKETWIATLDIRRSYVQWSRIDVDYHRQHFSQTNTPTGRFKHTMVKTTYIIVMYGGETNDRECLDEIWHFDVRSLSWTNATMRINNDKPSLDYECFSIGTSLKNSAAFAVKSETSLNLWLYHPETYSWTFISRMDYTESKHEMAWAFSLHVWRHYLVVYDSENVEVVYSYLVCPEGFGTAPLTATKTYCSDCGAGLFSKRDDLQCTHCPTGLTTEGKLSTSVLNCSQCDTAYCKHGRCDLIREDIMRHAVCHCDNGYSGVQCQYPTYILIALGVAVLVFLLTVIGGLFFWRYRMKKRWRERNLVQQVNELTVAWQINASEINLLELIGSGAFGEVFRAEYRDMIVAVKMLRCHEDEQSVMEFEREIQFCQTIRHPHIVLFIGAGRRDTEGTPFIVTEFMERGSLRDVLDDIGVVLLPYRKVQFGVDIASGMEFLHGLQPPRIHRDLKSNNILVGRNFSAKVADFGLGRQMPLKNRGIVVGETPPGGLTTPLLNSMGLTMIGIGTARWRAPELFARQNYTTAIDVYSFGILLWEIWTRRLPFQNYGFDYEVKDAVLAGERPIIQESCPADFRSVMTHCWQPEPCARPLFSEIIGRLSNCLDKLAQ